MQSASLSPCLAVYILMESGEVGYWFFVDIVAEKPSSATCVLLSFISVSPRMFGSESSLLFRVIPCQQCDLALPPASPSATYLVAEAVMLGCCALLTFLPCSSTRPGRRLLLSFHVISVLFRRCWQGGHVTVLMLLKDWPSLMSPSIILVLFYVQYTAGVGLFVL